MTLARATSGAVQAPAAWNLQWWNGQQFVDVTNPSGFGEVDITSVREEQVVTRPGVAPQLPPAVTVTFNDGSLTPPSR